MFPRLDLSPKNVRGNRGAITTASTVRLPSLSLLSLCICDLVVGLHIGEEMRFFMILLYMRITSYLGENRSGRLAGKAICFIVAIR